MLRELEQSEVVLHEGDAGESFYVRIPPHLIACAIIIIILVPDSGMGCPRSLQIIVEGILEHGTKETGRDEGQMLAGETFGHESLIEQKHVNKKWISCTQPTKLLEIKKEYFDRYVRPLQLAEWARVATLVSELSFFNEPGEEWEGNRLNRLLRSLQLKTYNAGELILSEGDDNKKLIFLLSGHCHVTKYVVDEKLKRRAEKLASPLRSSASMAMANGHGPDVNGGREIDIAMLYRGALLDPEAVLEMKASTIAVRAKSHVEVVFINTNDDIFIDDPVSLVQKLGVVQTRPSARRARLQRLPADSASVCVAGDRCGHADKAQKARAVSLARTRRAAS